MKQETLAAALGITRQAVSKIEQNATIDEELLEKIANVLGVSKEGIKHFNEERVFNNINTFHDNSIQNVFNPLEKIVQLYEQIIKDKDEIIEMYKKQQQAS